MVNMGFELTTITAQVLPMTPYVKALQYATDVNNMIINNLRQILGNK